jgi:hypothetical protein
MKYREITQYKSFTQEPKLYRKKSYSHGTVRNRCIQFLESLDGIQMLPVEEAINLFKLNMEICDRCSVKAYFGNVWSEAKKHTMTTKYKNGTFSQREVIHKRSEQVKGYFELFGLANYERVGKHWFMKISLESLVPTLNERDECLSGLPSITSLSQYHFSGASDLEASENRETIENKRERAEREMICCERNSVAVKDATSPYLDKPRGFLCSCGHQNTQSFFCEVCGKRNVATYG